jgi:N-acetylglutamate synthase-like GNAT family acetyltransferase
MGRAFYAESAYGNAVAMDDASVVETARSLIDSEIACLFVAEHDGKLVGMIGGIMTAPWINRNVPLASELFWWVAPDQRGGGTGARLLLTFTNWAKDNNAHAVCMMNLSSMPEVEQLYARMGFSRIEQTYIRTLT